eukprot:7452134-Alexandrium_andersonii.AAC.1
MPPSRSWADMIEHGEDSDGDSEGPWQQVGPRGRTKQPAKRVDLREGPPAPHRPWVRLMPPPPAPVRQASSQPSQTVQ